MIQKGPSLHGSKRLVADQISVRKQRYGQWCIKALLKPCAKYCGLRKDPQVTRNRAECVKSFLSAPGQGRVIAEEHPVDSSRSKCMRCTKGSESWPYQEGDGHKDT